MGKKSGKNIGSEKNIGSDLRIIGGQLRGRKIRYSGDSRTRPMKERVREAMFNLIGTDVVGTHVIDLFAGTGALSFEALSRGAEQILAIERHFPTARLLEENAASLNVQERVTVFAGDTFFWSRQLPDLSGSPCSIFCSPPYRLYHERTTDMLALIGSLMQSIPDRSLFVVECDSLWDTNMLPSAERWDVRAYSPAVIAIHRTPATSRSE
ncbi:MAG: RsmD family RNA methyltransferase [Pirellulaceae bacterium]|nr:RsmD family RNA methyltransferase [Planctomycetales bacterium]